MRNMFIASLLVLLMSSISFGYTTLDYSWVNYNGHSYTLTKDSGNWKNVSAEALDTGGHLLTINTAEENNWIVKNFDTFGPWASPITQAVWIGYYKITGNIWVWESGESVIYTNIVDNNVITGKYMYIRTINHPDAGTWGSNGLSLYGIIETPIFNSIPVPGAIILGSIGIGFVGWLRQRNFI